MNGQSESPPPQPYFLEFAPHYLRFLVEVRQGAEFALAGCDRLGWDRKRDVRPCFLSRMVNLSRALSYLIACAHQGRVRPDETLRAAALDEHEIHGALGTLYPFFNWGTLATWFGAFELALCDLARGIREQDPSAPFRLTELDQHGRRKRRSFRDIAQDVSRYVLDEADGSDFRAFCDLAGGMRNTVHLHGICDPWARNPVIKRAYGRDSEKVRVEFHAGKVPQVHGPLPIYMLWLHLAPDALGKWARLLGSERVRALTREITDSACVERPPEWESFIRGEESAIRAAGIPAVAAAASRRANAGVNQPLVEALLEFAAVIPSGELFPSLVEGASALATQDPFAFLLACVLDRGTPSEVIWTIPHYLRLAFGALTPQLVANKSEEEVATALGTMPRKPRYIHAAPRTIRELAHIVATEFESDAALVWRGRSAAQVHATLRRIHGVGPGIASMTVLLLERAFKLRFADMDRPSMDIKADVHTIRVLYRAGVSAERTAESALATARGLHPSCPGDLDAPLWGIGRRWCRETAPRCSECCLDKICAKRGVNA